MAEIATIAIKVELVGLDALKELISALDAWASEANATIGDRTNAEARLLGATLALAGPNDPDGEAGA